MNIDELKNRVTPFEQFSVAPFEQWGDSISPAKLAKARTSHSLNESEYVFFLRDYTFWGSASNSLLMTDLGVSAKFADELQPLFLTWKEIDYFDSSNRDFKMGSGGKEYLFDGCYHGVKKEFIDLLMHLSSEEASSYALQSIEIKDSLEKAQSGVLTSQENSTNIKSCDQLLCNSLSNLELELRELPKCQVSLFDYFSIAIIRSKFLILIGKNEQAKSDLLKFIADSDNNVAGALLHDYFDAYNIIANICTGRNEFDDAAVYLKLAAGNPDPDCQREANEALEQLNSKKMASLSLAPVERRQMILCTDDIPSAPVKEFTFVDASMLRSLKWKFEAGHPQAGEMYICHPLRTDHYYELQSFHDKLFDEKRSELVYLLESIGARHVHVETMSNSTTSTSLQESSSTEVADKVITGATVGYKQEMQSDAKSSKRQIGIEDRELNPAPDPHIPKDMVWYPHEQSWQRIAAAALANRYKTLSVELQYEEDFSINQKRMKQVSAGLKLFSVPIESGWNSETESRLRERKATIWKYIATFGDDSNEQPQPQPQIVTISANEADYLEELKAALVDGPLVESARHILDRQRKKLGISDERAAELEKSLAALQLTENEKEYMQDLEDCLADNIISDSERNMLERRRVKLGLSESRVSELEQLVKAK